MAPASRFPYGDLIPGLHQLRHDWRLEVLEGQSLKAQSGPFAGSVALRLHDLQTMLDNPSLSAILAARGGYGSYQLVDELDFTGFLKAPKWLVGFSDITLLHCQVQTLGVQSLHAIMPRQFGQNDVGESVESLRRWLFGELPDAYAVPADALNRRGRAEGILIGGNLTLLLHTLATPSEPEWPGKILFIEDIDETYFSLDRMLTQLRRAGRLAQLAGLIVGQFTDLRENQALPYGKTAGQLIAEAVADYDFPVCYNFPVGHVDRNLAMPLGRTVELRVDEAGGTLLF